MVILSISKLNNKQYAGTNINIPKFVRYLNNICDSGYLDCGEVILDNFKGFKNYFRLCDYKKFSINKLPKPFNKPDIVVFQDFYYYEAISISKELIKKNIPYTIIPRCALTYEAQKRKFVKKNIGNILFFNNFINHAKFIHFLTENEYLESKRKFKIKDYVIIGNGVEMPQKFYKLHNRKEFIITFLGRYNIYHKGLDILLSTIKENKKWFLNKNVKLYLYGKDSEGGYQYLYNYIDRYKLDSIVKLNGPVYERDKEKVLLHSDIFIHTSRLEGHPTSVIEAISYGIPVIVTPGTNVLQEVKKYKLGFCCDQLNSKAIFDSLQIALESKKEFLKISKNEIEYAKENFDWKNITSNIYEQYKIRIKGD